MASAEATCVLVVEDDRNIVDLLRSNLLVRGFSVVVSTTGADALELLDPGAPRHRPGRPAAPAHRRLRAVPPAAGTFVAGHHRRVGARR